MMSIPKIGLEEKEDLVYVFGLLQSAATDLAIEINIKPKRDLISIISQIKSDSQQNLLINGLDCNEQNPGINFTGDYKIVSVTSNLQHFSSFFIPSRSRALRYIY